MRARDVLREAVELRAGRSDAGARAAAAGPGRAAHRRPRGVRSGRHGAHPQNRRSARAYIALGETLEERRRYQDVADALAPAVQLVRNDADAEGSLSMLLPHLGFAYQQLGQFDKAIAALQEAHKVTGGDPAVSFYLIQAQLSAKR